MQDAVFFALVGLFLLVPLEVFFLIIAAALANQSRKQVVSEPEVRHYGWEGYISLDYRKSPSHSFLIALAIAAVIVLVPLSVYLVSLSPSIVGNESVIPVVNGTGFPQFSLPAFNLSFPEVNASGILRSSAAFFSGRFFLGIAVVVLVLAVVFFLRRVRAHSEDAAAAEVKKSAKSAKAAKKSVSGRVAPASNQSRPFRRYSLLLGVVAVVALLSGVGLLVYSVRGRIMGLGVFLLSGVFGFLSSVRDFAFAYRFYILAGIVVLALVIAVLRFFGSRRS